MDTQTAVVRWGVACLAAIACTLFISTGAAQAAAAGPAAGKAFKAEGLVRIEPGISGSSGDMFPRCANFVPVEYYTRHAKTQMAAIRSQRALLAALDTAAKKLEKEGLKQTLYTGVDAAQALQKDLRVSPVADTFDVAVSLSGKDRAQVLAIVNGVLDAYVSQVMADKRQIDADRRRDLNRERDDLQRQLADLSKRLAMVRSEGKVITTAGKDGARSESAERLVILMHQEEEARSRLAEAKAAWDVLQVLVKAAAENVKERPAVISTIPAVTQALEADPVLVALRQEVMKIEIVVAGEGRPTDQASQANARVLLTNLANMKALLDRTRMETAERIALTLAATAKAQFDRAQAAATDLETRIAEARHDAVDAMNVACEYQAREAEFKRVQAMYSTVMDGLERMVINAVLSQPQIYIAQYAVVTEE